MKVVVAEGWREYVAGGKVVVQGGDAEDEAGALCRRARSSHVKPPCGIRPASPVGVCAARTWLCSAENFFLLPLPMSALPLRDPLPAISVRVMSCTWHIGQRGRKTSSVYEVTQDFGSPARHHSCCCRLCRLRERAWQVCCCSLLPQSRCEDACMREEPGG